MIAIEYDYRMLLGENILREASKSVRFEKQGNMSTRSHRQDSHRLHRLSGTRDHPCGIGLWPAAAARNFEEPLPGISTPQALSSIATQVT